MKRGLHTISLPALFKELGSKQSGLTQLQVEHKLKLDGPNKLTEKKEKPLILQFILEFHNFFSYLLITGAILSFIGESLVPGQGNIFIAWALVGVTILNSFFTFIQKFKTRQAMNSFQSLLTSRVTVLRNGQKEEIDSEFLVAGDIIFLEEGDKVTADARLIDMHQLKVDHSALTGESEPQLRSLKATHDNPLFSRNMVFSGTLVQQGTGTAIVIATGDRTQIGLIAKETTQLAPQVSHLQKQIQHFIRIISRIAISLGILFFMIGFFTHLDLGWQQALIINLVFAIGIIVANVPEGLLPTVTLTLSLAAQKLAKQNVLIKNVDAIETMGSITVICTDKTGTLTENKLTVTGFYLDGKEYAFDSHSHAITYKGKVVPLDSVHGSHSFFHSMVLCNNSLVSKTQQHGDPTEISLKQFVSQFKNPDYITKAYPRLQEIPFNSESKYMITAHEHDKQKIKHLKGAPEAVLDFCTHVIEDGKKVRLTAAKKTALLKKNHEYAKKGLRVLGFGSTLFTTAATENTLLKKDYTFLGLSVMQDPPRHDVADAVAKTHAAGIKIVVISGDQATTVQSIAEQVGIIDPSKPVTVVEGSEIGALTNEQLLSILKNEQLIFARALPQDKLKIVSGFKELGDIVAVTGDGVNDAPALKHADVGIAMGLGGTEVAKEASDVILLDDNFASITRGIEWGRTIYDNIKHFITYILTSNTPEIIPFLVFVLFDWPLALPTLLILAIDLGTDLIPAIGLGLEKPLPDTMTKKPRPVNSKLLNWRVIAVSYGSIGLFQTLTAYVVFFGILFEGGWSFGDELAITSPLYMSAVAGFFMGVVISQMYDVFVSRTTSASFFKTNFFGNKVILFGIFMEIVLLLALLYVEPLRITFGLNFYDFKWVLVAIVIGSSVLWIEEIRKYFLRKYGWFSLE